MTTTSHPKSEPLSPSFPRPITGADRLLDVAIARGADVCFANPGTTEMALVEALDRRAVLRPVPTLFEGVATGAADGYARVTGRPALTLLHLGPGLANGLANLHNARRARTPVVNLVGDHATWHREHDAPLSSDIDALAGAVGWVRTSREANDLPSDVHAAFDAATVQPGAVATLVVPADLQEARTEERPATTSVVPGPVPVPSSRIRAVAERLQQAGSGAVLLLGGEALRATALRDAARISAATDARVLRETFHSRMDAGGGTPHAMRLPYFPEDAMAALKGCAPVVLAGALEPVSFFGWTGLPGRLADEGSVQLLAQPGEDVANALAELADMVGAAQRLTLSAPQVGQIPTGRLDAGAVGRIVARLLPEGCIVSVEGSTSANAFYDAAAAAPQHTSLSLTGGAIGQGLPVALGAAVAAPERQVVALQSDGSAQYTIQALWTMARERARVVTVIVSNRSYGILRAELRRMGIDEPGPASDRLTRLDTPAFDWPSIARGYGVDASQASTGAELSAALRDALRSDGPHLIEALI